MSDRYLLINSKTGGPAVMLEVQEVGGVFVISGISVSGLGLTTAGVTDSLNKRFVTDAELTALQALTNKATEVMLAEGVVADLNSALPTDLYTVPGGKTAIITKIIMRGATVGLDTVQCSFGYNDPDYNDLIANGGHSDLTSATLYEIVRPQVSAALGVAASVLKLQPNVLQGVAASVTVDVIGYLF